MQTTVGLYWFTNDLRRLNNSLLDRAFNDVDELVAVYCLPRVTEYLAAFSAEDNLGTHRERFIHQSVEDLSESLAALGVELIIVERGTIETLAELIGYRGVSHLYVSESAGFDETAMISAIKQKLPMLEVVQSDNTTLFHLSQLPFPLDELPATFTQFRKKVEPIFEHLYPSQDTSFRLGETATPTGFVGGERAAIQHATWYFSHPFASTYKETRNRLEGDSSSTHFSPWLALGCVSPAQIVALLRQYEQRNGANQSTYWIVFELLWREYFYWYGRKHQEKVFYFSGLTSKQASKPSDDKAYQRWVKGETDFAIVNACMNQLKETGFMSNRGRQLVASCLIHELGVDWRRGAAYFETQLIDYDVASNWGNWQYLSGVGADPNPARRFNLLKQAELYDPDSSFTLRWQNASEKQ